jgi:predicted NAD/FAD-binding protein
VFTISLLYLSSAVCLAGDRPKLGIIGGGGSGLITAWLLEKDYDVTLFEKEDRLGGHANTVSIPIDGKEYPIDAGFEFFADSIYPHFNRLLELLEVPTRKFDLTYTFYRTDNPYKLVLPPLHNGKIKWASFQPRQISTMLQLKYLLTKAEKIVDTQDTTVTIEKFVEGLHLSSKVKARFIYPFFAGMWGVTVEDVRKFAAYPILKWLVKNSSSGINPPRWNEIVGGTATYIKHISDSLKETKIKLSATIKEITYHDNRYQVEEENGAVSEFDYLVMATNANQAKVLLKSLPETKEVRSILGQVEYFHTYIIVHSDERYMPKKKSDWSVYNIRSNGIYSQATVYKPWRSPKPVFRSWITHDFNGEEPSDADLPQSTYAKADYYHPKLNLNYFKAQKELAKHQGENNLWFSGVYTYDTVSHDSVVVAGMKIAQNLAPHSERLQLLQEADGVPVSKKKGY